ncbi:MAG: porin [Aquabacterium sp.]|uniref:porin n=1 Tax=Aquabacterium sp. TaxID=1872578 RepID=UPI002716E383|nr:porin [Aquabacterium sp.]MDO9004233.1 porin [Aquabacterium sp.]
MFAKKNVVAAAALTLLAVAAHAQVTVYGNLDVSVGRKQVLGFDGNGDLTKVSSTNVDSSDMAESYIGFKGQEDLGGGLKAIFKLESELGVDTGAAAGDTFWNRNATVGLAGDFGAVNLGRFENLFKLESAQFNPFGSSATFSPSARLGLNKGTLGFLASSIVGGPVNFGSTDGSWSNGVSYVSPNLGGLTLSVQTSMKEGAKGDAANYSGGATAVSANYTAGPLALSAVVGEIRSASATPAATPIKDKAVLLGASYDFGVVKLFGQYGQDKLVAKATDGSVKPKFFQLGGAIPVSEAGSVLLSAGQTKVDIDTPAASIKTRAISAGYNHNLSKRTSAYAAYINERTSASSAGGSGSETTNSVAVGVRHAF